MWLAHPGRGARHMWVLPFFEATLPRRGPCLRIRPEESANFSSLIRIAPKYCIDGHSPPKL